MPAEIDTGGPRVLHCDYRADCPIPNVTSSFADFPLNCKNEQIGKTFIARKNNEFDDGAAKLRCRCFNSSAGFTYEGFHRVETSCLAFGNLSACHKWRQQRFDDALLDTDCSKGVTHPEQLESRLCESINNKRFSVRQIRSKQCECSDKYNETKVPSRKCINDRVDEPRQGTTWYTDPYQLKKTAGNRLRFRGIRDRVRTEKTTGWFSSQLSDRSKSNWTTREQFVRAEVTATLTDAATTNSWSGDSCVTKVVASVEQPSNFRSSDRDDQSLKKSGRRTRKKKRECSKRNDSNHHSTYIQLVLLLFLVAFGQCGFLRKSSALNYAAVRPSSTGLSVFTIGTVIGAVSAAPVDLMGDAGVRAERSANLSHITGASRKIQMYIKNRHLQILPDGTVNGSNDDTSDYTIFQRTSVSRGQLRIQGVATCLYLCMDSCGLLYGSREYTDDCVFNETLEQHNYNTYSSAKWSTVKKTLYLGLNRRGQPRRVQAKGHNLGRLSAYARVLTQVAPMERVEALQRRMLGVQHNVRHRHNSHRGDLIQQSLCPTLPVQEKDGRDKFRCRKRKKRKKRKRKCRIGEKPGPQCQAAEGGSSTVPSTRNEGPPLNGTSPESKRSCEGAASEEACRREALLVPSKKRKLRVEEVTERERRGEGAVAGVRNVTANNNGKSKAPASNAKKVNTAGNMSQSKKPNLTDGKKKKKKGPSARRNPAAESHTRKRLALGRVDNSTSAAPMPTSASTSVMSSSSWWSSGASIAPSGRGASPKRRTKPLSSKRKAPVNPHTSGALGPRRIGKAFGRNRTKTTSRIASTIEMTTSTPIFNQNPTQSVTVKVPDTVSDRSSRDSNATFVDLSANHAEQDEDQAWTSSNEGSTTAVDTTTLLAVVEVMSTTFRSTEVKGQSNDKDNERFDTTDTIQPTTQTITLERLAM